MKKRVIFIIGLVLLFLTGLAVMLYPVFSDYMNSLSRSQAIVSYNEELRKLSEADYTEIIESAREYNKRLANKQNRFIFNEEDRKEYYSILDFTGRGIIGTIEIPAIKVNLPIYLGTDENILQVGIGHFEGSSLPVGGPGTHSVISGHRGLPSSTLLTNADLLEIGDVFVLKILNETLYYKIDQSRRVLPENFDYLGIEPDKDYCTLLTCTPYGINSHRLLLRGCRIFPDGEDDQSAAGNYALRSEASRLNPVAACAIVATPLLLISITYMFIKYLKSNLKSKGRR